MTLLELLEPRTLLAGDIVIEWNNLALEAVKLDHGIGAPHLQAGPTAASRALAMVHAAIYDAVNIIDPKYTPYFVKDVKGSTGASLEVAAAQAAHDTLASLYPYLTPMFDTALANNLKGVSTGKAKAGKIIGAEVASRILVSRVGDGSTVMMNYTPGTLPGQWRPDPLHPDQMVLGPDWGGVTPFGISSTDDFVIPPPPSLTSPEYAAAFQEVKAYGDKNSVVRTADQTEAGIYWGYDGTPGLGPPPRLYNQIAQTIANQQHNTVVQNARMFALINIAMADAGIVCWNDKFTFNFWRPITAVRENDAGTGPSGLGSGNVLLLNQGDVNWEPLGAPNNNGGGTNFTPPFPAYASGHATFGGAFFKTMADFYGRDDVAFTFVSDEFNGITTDQNGDTRPLRPRSFDSFSEAAEENGQSRIYLGIHWSFDKINGINCGSTIADYVYSHLLQPLANGGVKGGKPAAATFSQTAIADSGSTEETKSPKKGSNLADLLA